MLEEIEHLTDQLLKYNQLFMKYYQEGREKGVNYDFHDVIKPFSDQVRSINGEWKKGMKNWLALSNHKHLHLKRIDTTSEHIEQLSIQAFFPETSRTRFLNAHRTVEFFLQEVLKEVKKEKRDA